MIFSASTDSCRFCYRSRKCRRRCRQSCCVKQHSIAGYPIQTLLFVLVVTRQRDLVLSKTFQRAGYKLVCFAAYLLALTVHVCRCWNWCYGRVSCQSFKSSMASQQLPLQLPRRCWVMSSRPR